MLNIPPLGNKWSFLCCTKEKTRHYFSAYQANATNNLLNEAEHSAFLQLWTITCLLEIRGSKITGFAFTLKDCCAV